MASSSCGECGCVLGSESSFCCEWSEYLDRIVCCWAPEFRYTIHHTTHNSNSESTKDITHEFHTVWGKVIIIFIIVLSCLVL